MPLLLPRLHALLFEEVGDGGLGSGGAASFSASFSLSDASCIGVGSVSWKEDGSGEGRRLRIREAKDSFEARVLKSRVVGGMVLGSWASLEGVDEGGGVGGRGRKKGILRGETSGVLGVLCGSVSRCVVFAAGDSLVLRLEWESSAEILIGSAVVAASVILLL